MDYPEMKKKMKALREQMETAAKDFFASATAELFTKHPKLNQFSWTQYTPYFNDGDTCEFSANLDYIDMRFDDEEHEYISKYTFDKDSGKNKPDGMKQAHADVHALLRTFEEDDFKTMFGDHKRVIVTAKKVKTEDYEHD